MLGVPKKYAKKGQELTVPRHFYQPKGSRVWYVRLVPPTHVKPFVSETEFRKSTGQRDLKRAIPIGAVLIAEKLREWDVLVHTQHGAVAQKVILTSGLIESICASRIYTWMRNDDDERTAGLTEQQLAEIEDFSQLTDRAMREVLARGPGSPRWSDAVEMVIDWVTTLGYAIDLSDPSFPQLVREFARAEKRAQDYIASRNRGDDVVTPELATQAQNCLSSVAENFKAFKTMKAETKHVGTILHAWKLFVEYCGDIPFDRVKPSHVFEFMESRMRAEVRPWSENRAKTFGKRALREVFGFARTKGLMSIPNPVDELEVFPSLSKHEEAARKNPRYPFTSGQLNSLFKSKWYDPNEFGAFRGKMREDLGARYWVPLIGLFHGNRVGEAVQLVASDFRTEGAIFVVTFRTEIDEGGSDQSARVGMNSEEAISKEVRKLRSLKNMSTSRTVPVHPALVALGLREFVELRRKLGGVNALLFPSSLPEASGGSPKLGRAYEQAFLRFVRDKLGFGRGFGNHSFRHQLEDRIRKAQATTGVWPPGLGQQFTGRKRTRSLDRGILLAEGSESAYGNGYAPGAMVTYLEKLDFNDVELPANFREWLKNSSA